MVASVYATSTLVTVNGRDVEREGEGCGLFEGVANFPRN